MKNVCLSLSKCVSMDIHGFLVVTLLSSYTRLAYLTAEECTVCFSLKEKKKCPGITSRYFLFCGFYLSSPALSALLPHFHQIYDILYMTQISSLEQLMLWGDLFFSSWSESWHNEQGALTRMSHETLWREELVDKGPFPTSFCPFIWFSSLFWLEWVLRRKMICFLAVLKRIYKLTFNIKLRLTAVTAEDKVNFECSLSWLNLIW